MNIGVKRTKEPLLNLMCMYRREKNEVKHRDASLDGKKSRSLYMVGKNLKNHWRAQRKWGRERRERRAKKTGEEPVEGRSEEMNEGEKKRRWGEQNEK